MLLDLHLVVCGNQDRNQGSIIWTFQIAVTCLKTGLLNLVAEGIDCSSSGSLYFNLYSSDTSIII